MPCVCASANVILIQLSSALVHVVIILHIDDSCSSSCWETFSTLISSSFSAACSSQKRWHTARATEREKNSQVNRQRAAIEVKRRLQQRVEKVVRLAAIAIRIAFLSFTARCANEMPRASALIYSALCWCHVVFSPSVVSLASPLKRNRIESKWKWKANKTCLWPTAQYRLLFKLLLSRAATSVSAALTEWTSSSHVYTLLSGPVHVNGYTVHMRLDRHHIRSVVGREKKMGNGNKH